MDGNWYSRTLIQTPVEALTFVVLAHKLAHGYTHVGFDIDEVQWDTRAFADADLRIVEGLAQFYTQQVSLNLENRYPDAILAFKELMQILPLPYTCFTDWIRDVDKAGEFVRLSLIDTRRQRITNYDAFLDHLETAKKKNK